MPIDASIATSFKQPDYANPLQQYGNVLAIQNASNQNALAQYTLSKARREDMQLEDLRQKVAGAGGPNDLPGIADALIKTGKPEYMQMGIGLKQKLMARDALKGMNGPQASPMDPNGSNPSVMAGAAGSNPLSGSQPNMMDPRVAGLLALDEPVTTEYAKMIQDANVKFNQPQVMRSDSTYVVGGKPQFSTPDASGRVVQWANGSPSISVLPGALRALGDTTGAVAGANAQYQTENVTQPNGAVVPTFKSQLPGFPGGSAPQRAAAAPAPARDVLDANGAITAIPAEDVAKARAAGIVVKDDPWSKVPKLPVGTGIGQSTFANTVAKESGKAVGELSTKYGQQADAANQRMALNNQALDLVDKADTGPFAARIADVKNVLTSRFGIPESSFENTPSATLALNKDLVQAATAKAKQQFGSRITQSEVMLMLNRASPNVDMPKAAIKYLLNTDNAAAKFQIQQADDLGKYVEMGGDPTRFEGWHAKNFPMTDAYKAVPALSATPAPVQQGVPKAGTVEDGHRFKGGNPADPKNWEKVSQ